MPGCTAVVVRARAETKDASPEILCVRRVDNGAWTPVTGIVDPGEEPAVACQREVMEEAAVVAVPRRLVSVEVVGPVRYANGDVTTFLDTAFLLEWVSGEPRPADGENTDARFVPADSLPPMNARFTRVIARALSDEQAAHFTFAEHGAERAVVGLD